MLKEWQFNILFFVGVGGALLLLLGPAFGLDVAQNPTALTGVGAILTYVLTQKTSIIKKSSRTKSDDTSSEPKEGNDDGS